MNKYVQTGLIAAAATCMLAAAVLPAREQVRTPASGTSAPAAPVPAVIAAAAAPVALPPDPVASSDRLYDTERAVAAARAGGAHENEVYRLRAASLSAREIAMLHEREQAEQEWNRRIAAWSAERARLEHDPAALQALQDRLFSKEEQSRLGAYTSAVVPQLQFD